MVDNTALKLTNVLEIRLVEVNALEKRIQKIAQTENADNDEDENDDADFIENKMKKIIDHHYESLTSIDRSKRIAFWDELNTQLHRLPKRCLTEDVERQMSLLEMICRFDFAKKPLSFAFEGIHNMDVLTECERQLLGLIDKLRNEYNLANILNTQHQSIRDRRRKIVLAVAGGLKAGKSSFINYLLESNVCPVGISETTARLTKITYGQQNLVKLESSTGELKEQYEINNDEQLKEATEKLIVLKGAAREESLCKDIVTIYLNREELQNIELWDIPGFDENPFLNSVVENILKETNIFFILTSITEAVRDTMVNLIRSCLEKHERQPQLCFIATKIDQVTMNPMADKNLDDTLDDLFHRIQDRYKVNLGDEWKSSSFFIPLCTNRKYNLKDFLACHEQFTRKLTQFFTHAVRFNTIYRLQYLIDMMHELLDYDDLNRNIQRDEKLANMLAVHLDELRTRFDEELKPPFLQIHQLVANRVSTTTTQVENDDKMRQILVNEIEKELLKNREEIDRRLSKCLNEYSTKLDQNPALTAIIHSLGERKLYGDPYEAVIGQYRNAEDSLLCSAKIYHTSTLKYIFQNSMTKVLVMAAGNISDIWRDETCKTISALGFSLFINYPFTALPRLCLSLSKVMLHKRRTLRNEAQANALLSVETILQGLIEDTINNIRQILCEQLNSINEDINRRKEKLIEKKDTIEARSIAQFLKNNNSSIVQVYLNLLDKANRFEYPYCEINCGDELGRSNFPVFAGKLGDTDRTNLVKIAVKRVPLRNFTWQEVRYMNELKHENILCYYGVRKSDNLEEHYDILMQQLDSDLTKYIDYASQTGKINDKLLDEIFIQITSGLQYLHEQDLIHRDIKPENILVQLRQNQSPIFVLADFGFIHRVPMSIKGTVGFLAPELLVRDTESIFITARIDIFALGATIRQTIDNSLADKQGKYVCFWIEISQRCLLNDPFQRPTCQQILGEHRTLTD